MDRLSMKIEAKKDDVLTKLKENRATHAQIVAEAREGYVEAAKTALNARLRKLKSGEITNLHFSLSPPQDYTNVYDTAIEMLEWHQGDIITLTAQEVQNLIQDNWDWMDQFLLSNTAYSATASTYAMSKSLPFR